MARRGADRRRASRRSRCCAGTSTSARLEIRRPELFLVEESAGAEPDARARPAAAGAGRRPRGAAAPEAGRRRGAIDVSVLVVPTAAVDYRSSTAGGARHVHDRRAVDPAAARYRPRDRLASRTPRSRCAGRAGGGARRLRPGGAAGPRDAARVAGRDRAGADGSLDGEAIAAYARIDAADLRAASLGSEARLRRRSPRGRGERPARRDGRRDRWRRRRCARRRGSRRCRSGRRGRRT